MCAIHTLPLRGAGVVGSQDARPHRLAPANPDPLKQKTLPSVMLLLLLAACDEPTPDTTAPTSETIVDTTPAETGVEPAVDTGEAPEPVVCGADKDAPTSTLFYCLSGMTCIGCDGLLELVLEIEVACVLDAELVYGERPGLTLLHYTDEVDLEQVAALIEDTENSLYTITCVEELQ